MIRKSRKQNNFVKPTRRESIYIQTAAYIRLSVEDRAKKGISVETQKQIIQRYLDDHPEFELYEIYIDLGVSGTTFNRPNMQRLLRDAEAGEISCVVVKDLSRLGRNFIDTGLYTEQIFPRLGIRLISITDNYDSSTYNGDISLPLMNLMNEAYVLDISRKTKSQVRQAMRDGVYVGGLPPYGYIKSPDNHRRLILDSPAAMVVKQIFKWAADGISLSEIARKLNTSMIPPPHVHKDVESSKNSSAWHISTIERILNNEIYQGHLAQGKTEMVNFVRKPAPSDKWIHAYDSHEAVVSPELFHTAQAIRQSLRNETKTNSMVPYSLNKYKGRIFCACCGGRMERTKGYNKYIFRCVSNRTIPFSCEGNRIDEDAVSRALSEQLLRLRDELLAQSKAPSNENDILREMRFLDMELDYLQSIIRSLYENLVTGTIDQNDYTELKNEYQIKMDEFNKRATELQRLTDDKKLASVRVQEVMDILNEFACTMLLDIEIVRRFIDRIEVSRNNRIHAVLKSIEATS